MNRLRRNAMTLVAALLLVCPSACAQGLVVRQPEGAPTGAPQDPKGDAELQQEIRALRDQAAQLEALVQQLQQRAKAPQGDERDGPRQDADQDRMRRMEQERFEREQQERKRAAADHIAQVEKRAQDEIARIKQNAQREIERIQAEVAQPTAEPRREGAERSPSFVRPRDDQGRPRQDRGNDARRMQQPQRGNVQLFEVDENGLPVRRVDEREFRGDRAPGMHEQRRAFDPEIDRLLEALRNRIAERRDEGQYRGRFIPPQDQGGERPTQPAPDAPVPPEGGEGHGEPRGDGGR
jgi:Skp family chaperone for outer membrane proteins